MSFLERSWYREKPGVLNYLLLPLAGLFGLVAKIRKTLFLWGVKSVYRAPVPVIVVGNIGVGGNGKTPFAIWLCDYLTGKGLKVAVISRGYGGQSDHYPLLVGATSDPALCGDEPVLLARRTGCPVMVGPDRKASIESLVAHFSPDVIVSDDGLQHYKMARDIELCIIDSKRRLGNGLLIPAGPLREPEERLKSVDLVIENGGDSELSYQLQSAGFFRVGNSFPVELAQNSGRAYSAIGNPARFESSLTEAGIEITATRHFRDHHAFSEADFADLGDDAVFMTEKDAVKCRRYAGDKWYYLKVDAKASVGLENAIHDLLKAKGILNGL